jgi:hypothetical protein
MNNGSVDIKRGGTGGRDQGVGRSGCEVGQSVDEVDAAGELISVIWTSISSAVKRVLTFGIQMQAKKHRAHEISTFLPTLPPADPPIRFRRYCIRGPTIRYARVLATARYYTPYTHLRTLSTYKWERCMKLSRTRVSTRILSALYPLPGSLLPQKKHPARYQTLTSLTSRCQLPKTLTSDCHVLDCDQKEIGYWVTRHEQQ